MPAINVKHATVEDVHHLYNLLPEFSALHSLQDLINRLNNKENYILVAYKNENLLVLSWVMRLATPLSIVG